ncbi:MAG TPA: cellulase family glycosylhydrolase [Terriglobia bacterium]|nr:cellulase family glycosylhydrolase [Terriglobia bacterium]
MKTRRAARKRQEFLEQLQAERSPRSQLAPRPREKGESRLAQLREEDRRVEQTESAGALRAEELHAAGQRRQQQAPRTAQLREEQRPARQREAAEVQREEELRAAVRLRQEEGRSRAAKLRGEQRLGRQREAAEVQREEELRAAVRRRQEEGQSRAAKLREERRLAHQTAAARTQREEESRAARAPESQDVQRSTRAAQLRPEHRLSLPSETTRARPEVEPRLSVRRQQQVQQEQREQESRAAQLRKEQRRRQVEERQREAALELAQPAEPQPETLRPRPPAAEEPAPADVRSQRQREAEATVTRGAARQQQLAQRRAAPQAEAHLAPRRAAERTTPEQPVDELLRLKTQDSFVVDDNGGAVNLRGVTVRGLDTVTAAPGPTFPAALALDDRNLAVLTGLWRVNLVRVPFQAQTILSGNGSLSGDDILAGLDDLVATVTVAGAYVLLALEAPPGELPLAPDANTFQAWQQLAKHYEAEHGVLYEIFASASPRSPDWLQRAAALVGLIRQNNPASLIFLGSEAGGVSVTELPLRLTTGESAVNIVYTIDVSPEHHPSPDDGELRALVESYPVFASEWSNGGTDFGRLSGYVADLLDRYGIGWAAANWNADPRLVGDAAHHDFTPTGWGLIVQRSLMLPARPLLKPFGAAAAASTLRTGNS